MKQRWRVFGTFFDGCIHQTAKLKTYRSFVKEPSRERKVWEGNPDTIRLINVFLEVFGKRQDRWCVIALTNLILIGNTLCQWKTIHKD